MIIGIKVKYNTQATYVYISVLTSSTSFPRLLHFLNKTKKYNTANIGKSINYLEGITIDKFRAWQQSIWLKGALALVLDEQQKTNFNGWNLSYSPKLGLCYEKQDNGC